MCRKFLSCVRNSTVFGENASLRQKPHTSGSECVQFVLRQGGGIPEGLADILFLEVG